MYSEGRSPEVYGLFRQHYEPAKKSYSDAYEDMYRRTEKSTAAGGYGISTRASEVLGNWLDSYNVNNTITNKISSCLDINTGKLRSDSIQTGMSLLGEYAVNYNRAHGMRAGWEDQGMSSNRGSVEKWAGFLGDPNAKRHTYW